MNATGSYRTILRSSSIMGASSFLNILAGVARMKAAALILGPGGVGVIGLYQNLIQTASAISALGLTTAGTRQIAAANGKNDPEEVARVRRALFWGTLVLSIAGATVFWLARGWIAARVLHDPTRSDEIGWLSIGVALTVAAGSQWALLSGLRRIGDVAKVQVASAVMGAAFGVLAIWLMGPGGVLAMVLVSPAITLAVGRWYVAPLRSKGIPAAPLRRLASEWRVMVALGFAFMLASLSEMLGQLAVRSIVQADLGLAALGQFQASWAIGMTYLGFVLGAMGADYYPRLSAAIQDPVAATRMVNEQTEVALLLCGPVILLMLALAPWVVRLLYSSEFASSADILRWQLLGDVLKVASWPLAFTIVAAARGRTYILTEASASAVFVAVTWVATPALGVAATGVAFLAMYVFYCPLVYWLARRRIGFNWDRSVIRQAAAVGATACAVAGAAQVSELLAGCIGIAAALGFGLHGFGRLGHMANLDGRLGQLAESSRRLATWRRRPL